MPRQETTNAGKLGSLVRLSASLNANAPDLPHLEGIRARFDKLVGEAQETAKQQTAFTASKQEASRRLNTQLSEALRLASGLRKLLEETYGVRSEKLAEYGLQPFRGRKLKGTAPEVPQKPEPPAVPTAPVDPNA